ncbi:uncharacterized protein K02A2.6-like isoform X3 [Ixodes scapularis]|uniref:uncharacterized protein K02A2.6-like isoform X3 n=1 Tax=Ixodes scapularis TaxID=6945 RepID=UPI001A9FB151|nr:uncharacterized protein K02A2.6-like isoform X3 [Ixodes scapularis]
MTAMKTSARAYIWWPKIDQAIEDFVRHCQQCQENRQSDPKAPVHFWIKPEQPWSRLHVDFAGPVRAPYHPASNGRAERMVREVKSALKKLTQGDTQCKISRFLFKQHTTPHSDTGKTPGEVMMGRRLRSPLDRLHPDLQRDPGADQPKVKRFYVGDTVYARNFVTGPRWKAAKVVAVTGPVSYKVQLANREVYRRHRDHLRKAWLDWDENLEADIDYDVKLPLTAAPGHGTPQASPARRNPERPVPQVVPSPAAQPEQPLRRSARERRPVIRYGTVPT